MEKEEGRDIVTGPLLIREIMKIKERIKGEGESRRRMSDDYIFIILFYLILHYLHYRSRRERPVRNVMKKGPTDR